MGQYYSTEAVETIQNLVETPGKKNGRKTLSDSKPISINNNFFAFLYNYEFLKIFRLTFTLHQQAINII